MNFLWIFIFLLISDADETANFPEARRTCGETQWNKKYELVPLNSYNQHSPYFDILEGDALTSLAQRKNLSGYPRKVSLF